MTVLAKATPATAAKTDNVKQIAILYAGILTIMAVAQLFTFEKFIELVPAYGLPVGGALVYLTAPLIVTLEVLAIPFLLRMKLSVAFRWLSMAASLIVAALWVFISTWLVATGSAVETVGFTGTLLELTPGWWSVLVSISLAILAAWASWGLWPGKAAKK